MRIVSLLPSTTEIVCALGLENELVGITHECDYPATITDRPRLTASRISHETMTSAEIDHAVRSQLDGHGSIYDLDENRLRELNPVLRPIDHEPGKMISAGALMDAGLVSGWNLTVGRSKPRVAITGLWVMTAFRAYLAIHNLRNEGRAAAR